MSINYFLKSFRRRSRRGTSPPRLAVESLEERLALTWTLPLLPVAALDAPTAAMTSAVTQDVPPDCSNGDCPPPPPDCSNGDCPPPPPDCSNGDCPPPPPDCTNGDCPLEVGVGDVHAIDEGGWAWLNASFTDHNLSHEHTVTIDWGDWNDAVDATFELPAIAELSLGQTITSSTGLLQIIELNQSYGWVGFRVPHRYVDDGSAPGNSTPVDSATIEVSISDNGSQVVSESADVDVHNVAPVAQIDGYAQPLAAFIMPGDVLRFHGSLSDVGVLDAHVVRWSFGDGSVIETELEPGGLTTLQTEHAYALPGTYTVTLTVSDDDGGSHQAAITVTVNSPVEGLHILKQQVQATSLSPPLKRLLVRQLDLARRALENDRPWTAQVHLRAFQLEIKALTRAGVLNADLGNDLLDETWAILRVIGGRRAKV